jgi:competence protein ComEC
MVYILWAYASGIALCALFESLPPYWVLLFVMSMLCLVGLQTYTHRGRLHACRHAFGPVFALMLGLVVGAYNSERALTFRINADNSGQAYLVNATVMGLPQIQAWGTSVVLQIEPQLAARHKPAVLATTWPKLVHLQDTTQQPWPAGTSWSMVLALHDTRSAMNEAGADREAWFIEKGYAARATWQGRRIALGEAQGWEPALHRLRQQMSDRVEWVLGSSQSTALIQALTVGDTSKLTDETWQLFSKTGSNHLVSISGLHITLFAGLMLWFSRRLLIHAPIHRLPSWMPFKTMTAMIAMLAAMGYALLAGWTIPTQRALWMLLGLFVGLCWQRRLGLPFGLALSAAVVLSFDPFAVLAKGFWLSFGLVAGLMLILGPRLGRLRRWQQLLWPQWVATCLSFLPLIVFFGVWPLSSFFANVFAIPWTSVLLVPLALVSLVDPTGFLWFVTSMAAQGLLMGLGFFMAWPQLILPQYPMVFMLGASCAIAAYLLPLSWRTRVACSVFALPLLLYEPPRPGWGDAFVDILDVGQGLSILVRTSHHTLLFDTGRQNANSVILPLLRAHAIKQLDALVLSHADEDHDGGWLSLSEATLPIHRRYAGQKDAYPEHFFDSCGERQSWIWDGVRFEFLALDDDFLTMASDNDRSCILMMTTAHQRLLITGDLSKAGELDLLSNHDVRADVLILGHHGSKTSTHPSFLYAVDPSVTIASVGYRNHYKHPSAEVLRTIDEHGSLLLRTDALGQIHLRLTERIDYDFERSAKHRHWRLP